MPSCTHTPQSLRATSPILVDLTKLYYLTPCQRSACRRDSLVDLTKLYYLTPLIDFEPVGNFLVDLTKLYYLTPLIDFEPVGNFLVDLTKLYYLTPLNGFTGRRYFYDFGTLRKVIFQEISPLVF